MTGLLDRLAGALAAIEPPLFHSLRPAARLTTPYIEAGVGTQQWNMFSSPFQEDNYVRLDYVVSTEREAGTRRHLRELVLPADREHHVRWVRRFRDKAILNAFETFSSGMLSLPARSGQPASESERAETDRLLRSFEPVTRYFRNRLTSRLAPGERVTRAELWYGAAPTPPRKQVTAAHVLETRLKSIEPFHDGPAFVPSSIPARRPRGATEKEADIVWTLLYVDEP